MAKMMIAASMLYDYTKCPHRVFLDCFGDTAERDEVDPFVELLWERGHAFEEETIAALGVPFLNLRSIPHAQKEELTLRAMREGEDLIYGGRITHGRLVGEPDLLRRSDGDYVPGDIKSGAGLEGASEDVAGKPKRHYAVQLALYSDILQQQGMSSSLDSFVWDIHGNEIQYNLSEPRGPRTSQSMWDEYREVLSSVEDVSEQRVETKPGLISECKLCYWRSHCRSEIVNADDLTLVAEIGRGTREKFPSTITTVAALANTEISQLLIDGKSTIRGIGEGMLRKFHARAVLQKEPSPVPYFIEEVRLPDSNLELFFDIETDPLRDLCYLHGFVERKETDPSTEEYVAFFADEATAEAEREAFARAWEFMRERSTAAVYYYSHYERTIWKRLAQRYPDVATEDDVGSLFDETRFVDLYTDIVRSRMIWPTYSLSIKALAGFLGFEWRDSDPSGTASIRWSHEWIETGDPAIRQRILDYNEDDCRATLMLVDALASLPGEVAAGHLHTQSQD